MATKTIMVKKTALTLLGLAAGILLAEVIVRIASPATIERFRLNAEIDSEHRLFCRYDERLGWSGIPGAEGEFRWIDCRHRVRQNRWGHRGPAYGFTRSGARRIVVLGDSYVWGYGVEEEELFTHLLETRSETPLEVVNTGVTGYGTDQEYLFWAESGHRWRPDLVLLVVTAYNDLFDIMFDERHTRPKPVFRLDSTGPPRLDNLPVPRRRTTVSPREFDLGHPSRLYPLITHSALASLVADHLARSTAIRSYLEDHRVIPRTLPGHGFEYPAFREPPHSAVERSWLLLDRLIAMLHRDTARHGARLVVAVAPASVQVYPDRWEDFVNRAPPDHAARLDPLAPNQRITAICRRQGIPIIDLLPALRQAARSNRHLYYPINNHWTADGHQVVAESLREALPS